MALMNASSVIRVTACRPIGAKLVAEPLLTDSERLINIKKKFPMNLNNERKIIRETA